MNSDVKNKQIALTVKDTLERHSLMDCCTFEVKVVSNKLNRLQKESVNGIFREAKWIRNAYITDKDNCKGNFKTVPVKAGDSIEIRELFYIGSQMKQSVIKQINSEIRSLSSHKKKATRSAGSNTNRSVIRLILSSMVSLMISISIITESGFRT